MRYLPLTTSILLVLSAQARAATVYSNTFDTPASLEGFSFLGDGTISIVNQQLQANFTSLFGHALGMLDTRTSFAQPYSLTLANNPGRVSWSFNVSNQDGVYNNGFIFVLASDQPDPFSVQAHGYYFRGGDMVGNRMGLWRFDYGLGGGQEPLIDIGNGLGPLPQTGSFEITYNPGNNQWALFGRTANTYSDPLAQQGSPLGTATDGTYTTRPTPYFGMGGSAPGQDSFDNVSVGIPEPSIATIFLVGIFARLIRRSLR